MDSWARYPPGNVPGGGWGLCSPAGLRHSWAVGVPVGQCRAPRASMLRPHGPSALALTAGGLQPDPSPGTRQSTTRGLCSAPALLRRALWATPRPIQRRAHHRANESPGSGVERSKEQSECSGRAQRVGTACAWREVMLVTGKLSTERSLGLGCLRSPKPLLNDGGRVGRGWEGSVPSGLREPTPGEDPALLVLLGPWAGMALATLQSWSWRRRRGLSEEEVSRWRPLRLLWPWGSLLTQQTWCLG